MQVRFVVLSRSGKERVIARPLPLLVGRDEEAGLRLPRDSVSRRHCEFLGRDGGVVVRDLGSTNGTLLGTRPIEPHCDVPVAAGSVLTIGGIRLRIEYDVRPAAAARPSADTLPGDSQTVSAAAEDVDDLLPIDDPPAVAPATQTPTPPAPPGPALAADDPPTEAAGAAAALADLEAAEDPAAAADFGFLAAEPAAAPPADWPDVEAPAAPPDDDDLNEFFKSLS